MNKTDTIKPLRGLIKSPMIYTGGKYYYINLKITLKITPI